jgi:hypothetical protein
LTGAAVKVTELPGHIVVTDADILTLGVTSALTVILMLLLVTVDGDGQVALEVITIVTTSVFARVVDVKVGESVPTLLPFTFH